MSPRERQYTSLAVGADYHGRGPAGPSDQDEQTTRIQYGGVGALFGVLLGIVIGSKITFHTPIRRRR